MLAGPWRVAQAHHVVVENHIHDPVQTVLDAPVGAGGMEQRAADRGADDRK